MFVLATACGAGSDGDDRGDGSAQTVPGADDGTGAGDPGKPPARSGETMFAFIKHAAASTVAEGHDMPLVSIYGEGLKADGTIDLNESAGEHQWFLIHEEQPAEPAKHEAFSVRYASTRGDTAYPEAEVVHYGAIPPDPPLAMHHMPDSDELAQLFVDEGGCPALTGDAVLSIATSSVSQDVVASIASGDFHFSLRVDDEGERTYSSDCQ